MLKRLGTIGKGLATFTGIAAIIASEVIGDGAADVIVGVGGGLGTILAGIGGLLFAFGVGRKAGVAAHDTLKAKGKVK